MKKKGFTLIELLAVIIILAIISLIVTPMISNLIQNARKAAAKTSAQGYVDAVKNKISLSALDNQNIHGIHAVSELDSVLEYSGTRVERGIVIVDGDILEEAKLCVNGYSFKYYSDKLEESNIDYCVDKSNLEITVLGTSIEEELNNQYSYDLDLTSYDISSATNVVCNNNAIPSVTNDTLHITDIYGDTKCSIENSIVTTFANLDDTTNNIVMIKDNNVNSTINIPDTKNVVLELNGQTIKRLNVGAILTNYGEFTVNDSVGTGTIVQAVENECGYGIFNYGNLIINGGTFESKNICAPLYSGTNAARIGNITINDGSFKAMGAAIIVYSTSTNSLTINGGIFDSYNSTITKQEESADGVINITGGTFTGRTTKTLVNNSAGDINIIQSDKPIYITSLAQNWNPAVNNNSSGSINITANQAYACTAISSETTSGLCVYAAGNGDYTKNDGNSAVVNYSDDGTININGGTYYGTARGISNGKKGTIIVKNAYVTSDGYAIIDNGGGKVEIYSTYAHSKNYFAVYNNNDATEIDIYSGTFISDVGNAISNNKKSVINIIQTDEPIYITTHAQAWKPAIVNNSTGSINITANQANACTANIADTTSGLCVYAEGDKNYTTGTANAAASSNGGGSININGGTYYGGNVTLSSTTGTFNIKNANLTSGYCAIVLSTDAVLNICSSSIENPSHDIYIKTASTVNYSSDVIFTDGTNTPTISTNNGTINAVATCPITE